ncbi:GDP-mannose 4,6-dehydratase [Cohnella zeiphila]|uniref:GDP-mannose 4,6-dehydratase n=1 Tax=Cohnella zeiphila TaxID=2761120 RepID=A0A7X0SSB5_9BACL|nr:GDP-mannose 4,6-dehydratase [Cohnella zeiphila]MBB6735184.1 GDP-mannose 4,6-dehydratase [Cohnella zeiphila]
MKTYWVTGGAGFIGSHLCESLLRDGHKVICVDSFADNYDYRFKVRNVLESLGMEPAFEHRDREDDLRRLQEAANSEQYRLEPADIRDGEALDRLFAACPPDVVVHLAALPGVRASIERPALFYDVNVVGTLRLLEAMRTHGTVKWVCASSSSVYGDNAKVPFEEGDPTGRPISPYAATKKSCELMGYAYRHLFGIDVVMLRFFTVYGERQRPDLAIRKFASLLSDGKPVPMYGDGSTSRDYTYVADIVDGIRHAADYVERHSGVYEIVNLGGSRTVSLARMIETLEQAWGERAAIDRQPMQPGDVLRTYADPAKARTLLGFEPSTPFEKGIERFVSWYRRQKTWEAGLRKPG